MRQQRSNPVWAFKGRMAERIRLNRAFGTRTYVPLVHARSVPPSVPRFRVPASFHAEDQKGSSSSSSQFISAKTSRNASSSNTTGTSSGSKASDSGSSPSE
jgi:hypothetical protein